MIKKINNFFFDEDEITLSDSLWFYGVAIGIPVLVLGIVIIGG